VESEKKYLILHAFNWLSKRKFLISPPSRQTLFYKHFQPIASPGHHPTSQPVATRWPLPALGRAATALKINLLHPAPPQGLEEFPRAGVCSLPSLLFLALGLSEGGDAAGCSESQPRPSPQGRGSGRPQPGMLSRSARLLSCASKAYQKHLA